MPEIDFSKLPDQKKIDFSALPDQPEIDRPGKLDVVDIKQGLTGVKEAFTGLGKRIGGVTKGEVEKAGEIAGEARQKFQQGEFIEGAGKTFAAGVKTLFSPIAGVFGGITEPAVEDAFGLLSPEKQESLLSGVKKLEEGFENLPSEAQTALQVAGGLLEIITTLEGGKAVSGVVSEGVSKIKAPLKKIGEDIRKFEFKSGREIELPKIGEAQPFAKDTLVPPPSRLGEGITEAIGKTLFADFKDPVDLSFRAIKPRIIKGTNLKKVKDNFKFANQTLVEMGFKPKNLKEYVEAIDASKRKIWGQIENKIANSDIRANVDLTGTALKLLKKSEDPALLRVNPRGAKQIEEFAENLVRIGGDVNVVEGEKIKQLLNAQLDDSFGQTDLSKPLKEAMKDTTRDIGVQLDNILSDIPGEFSSLKKKYGSLRSIEDDVVKRMIVFERQNPEDLVSSLTKIEAVAGLITPFGNLKDKAKSIQRLTVAKVIKERNDANKMIQKAFDLIKTTKPIQETTSPRIPIPPQVGQGTS